MINVSTAVDAVLADIEGAFDDQQRAIVDAGMDWLQNACENRLFKYFKWKPEYRREYDATGNGCFVIDSKLFKIHNDGATIPARRAKNGKSMPIPKVKRQGTLVKGTLDSVVPDRRKLNKNEIAFAKSAKGFEIKPGRWDLTLVRELEQASPDYRYW